MKVITVLGTRPEIIRLSTLIPLLDRHCDHKLVFTGQNFDKNLSDIFFKDLKVRNPDFDLAVRSKSPMDQIASILTSCENIFLEERPDKILILGDTNSGLSAIVARRMGIPVYHMEAGNRCFDDRVPEEMNRRIIDHISNILMPYTERSRMNLIREGLPVDKIFVTGNPIGEVLDNFEKQIEASNALDQFGVESNGYFLVTLHRAENVDDERRLLILVASLNKLVEKYDVPLIWSVHPRTKSRLLNSKINLHHKIQTVEPLGLFDFVKLEKNSRCVLTDSGTVQEECCLFRIPNITLRDVTERPETMESGSNIITGCTVDSILRCAAVALDQPRDWISPPEYLKKNVSSTVLRIITSELAK